jgi:two-component system response regulator YesN
MIGLLMVEDEEAIRRKLINNVAWSEYDLTVESAANGLEALAVLEANPAIRIVVTDIQMSKLNGIELIREIKRRDYPVKIVVISGFAEFEYAQESIKLNVADYLLKPFASRRLLEVVSRLKNEILQEETEKSELNSLREQLSRNREALREKLLMDLIGGNYPYENADAQLEFLGLAAMRNRDFLAVLIEIPENRLTEASEEDKYLLNMQFFLLVKQLFSISSYDHYIVNYRRNQSVVILFNPDPELPMRLEEILTQLHLALNTALSCGVGRSYRELTDLSISYKEACSASQYRYLYGVNRVFSINDLNLDNPSHHKIFYQLYRHRIFDDLKIGADSAVREDLVDLIREIRNSEMNAELSKIVGSNLVLLACATLNELGYNAMDIIGSDFLILQQVGGAESLDQLEAILSGFFVTIQSWVCRKRSSINHQLIEEVRRYLDENFASNITLSATADRHKISPSYLSLLFAEITGKKFIDYLTERRIKKARELLKHSEMKVYEVSGAVGYNDSFYFSNCFKKLTGVSPSDYRESMRESPEKDG